MIGAGVDTFFCVDRAIQVLKMLSNVGRSQLEAVQEQEEELTPLTHRVYSQEENRLPRVNVGTFGPSSRCVMVEEQHYSTVAAPWHEAQPEPDSMPSDGCYMLFEQETPLSQQFDLQSSVGYSPPS